MMLALSYFGSTMLTWAAALLFVAMHSKRVGAVTKEARILGPNLQRSVLSLRLPRLADVSRVELAVVGSLGCVLVDLVLPP